MRGPPGTSGVNGNREEVGMSGPNYVLESKVEDVVYYRDRKVMDQAPGECVFGLLLTVSVLHVHLYYMIPEFSLYLVPFRYSIITPIEYTYFVPGESIKTPGV